MYIQRVYLEEKKDFKVLEKASQNVYSLQNKSLESALD